MGRYSHELELGSEAGPILPSQFFEGRSKNEALEPEKRLMLAVLTDAVHCYQVCCDAQKTSRIRAFREAEQWLFSAEGYGPFSFENVCDTLDITPDYLRKLVRKWRVQRVHGARLTAVRRGARNVSKQPDRRYINSACTYR
jgi:hypothetical protein